MARKSTKKETAAPVAVIDPLARAKAKAKPKADAKDKGIQTLILSERPLADKVVEVCELAHIQDQMKKLSEARQDDVATEFTRRWVKQMWEQKTKPENWKAQVNTSTGMPDCRANFILKFRQDCLKKKLPKPDQIPEGKTLQEVLVEWLMKPEIGMTEKNAMAFVADEIVIRDELTFVASLDTMWNSEEGTLLKAMAVKIFTLIQTRSERDDGMVLIPGFTNEEEEALIQTQQVVTVKEDVAARVFNYCTSEEQLLKLLTSFLGVTQQVSNFEYAVSDEPAVRNQRTLTAVNRYLLAKQKS